MKKISKISPVDPREVWPNEEMDFTPWLKENFNALMGKIGLSAINVEKEEKTEV